MRIVGTGPDAYLASLPDEHRDTLTSVDRAIHRALPDRRRVLWQGVFAPASASPCTCTGCRRLKRFARRKGRSVHRPSERGNP